MTHTQRDREIEKERLGKRSKKQRKKECHAKIKMLQKVELCEPNLRCFFMCARHERSVCCSAAL